MTAQINIGTDIHFRFIDSPLAAAQLLSEYRCQTTSTSQLAQLKHHPAVLEVGYKRGHNLAFPPRPNDRVQIVCADQTTRKKLETTRHHARELRRTFSHGQGADQ